MNPEELQQAQIAYDTATKRLRDRHDLTMEEAVRDLDSFCTAVHYALTLHTEDSLQEKSNGSEYFLYRWARSKEGNNSFDVTFRTADQTPQREVVVSSTEYNSEDEKEHGHTLHLRTRQIIPNVYHENLPEISIPRSSIAEGIEPDGEWRSITENGITTFRQYPWQARINLGTIHIETAQGYFADTERTYSDLSTALKTVKPFWGGFQRDVGYVPQFNHRLIPSFYKEIHEYARKLKSIFFGTK